MHRRALAEGRGHLRRLAVMTAESPAQVITLLSQGKANEILGTPESAWVDFKSPGLKGPYDLSTDKGKFELAKDVAAFANAGGGLIVCGFKATQRATELHEVAERCTPILAALINSATYKAVIAEYIRPIVKVDFHRFDAGAESEAERSYFVIEVTALPEAERWAVVTRTINEAGNFIKGSWTLPIRNGDATVYLSPEEAYRLINDGMRARQQRPAASSIPTAQARAVARSDLRAHLDLADAPVLYFQTSPPSPNVLLPGMFSAGGLKDRLANQGTLRSVDAFNFATRRRPEVFEGGLRLAVPPRYGLRIESDGSVTAVAAATSEMLCWGMERFGLSQGDHRISVFVLTELTLEYFRLIDRFVIPPGPPWQHEIYAEGFTRPPVRLMSAADPQFPLSGSPQPASKDSWSAGWEAARDPERDAYEALRRLYPLFGLDVTDSPFVDQGRVSPTKLLGTKD